MIGNVLKLIRIYNEMSISEVSRKTCLNPNLISKLENGKTKIYLKTLIKLSECYKIPISQILYLNDMKESFFIDNRKLINDIKLFYICKSEEEKPKVKRIGV